jgi:hypothetical protein
MNTYRTYVVRIRNSGTGCGTLESDAVAPDLVRGLVREFGVNLVYMEKPSSEYPLTLVCNEPNRRAINLFVTALGRLQRVRVEVAQVL